MLNFLHQKGNKWIDTGVRCPRDSDIIFREHSSSGKGLNYFCCERHGCTWADHENNKYKIRLEIGEIDEIIDYIRPKKWKINNLNNK